MHAAHAVQFIGRFYEAVACSSDAPIETATRRPPPRLFRAAGLACGRLEVELLFFYKMFSVKCHFFEKKKSLGFNFLILNRKFNFVD